MTELLLVANETLASRKLLDTVRKKARLHASLHVRLIVPPSDGLPAADTIARVRMGLAMALLTEEGIESQGGIGDPDAFTATMDAIHDRAPDEVVISTRPKGSSEWVGADVIASVAEASGLPVEHLISDIEADGARMDVTLLLGAATAASREVREHLALQARESAEPAVIVMIPQAEESPTRLEATLVGLADAGLAASGMVGDADPYTAAMDALAMFSIDRLVISTLPPARSSWVASQLVERLRESAGCPVEHVVADVSQR